VTALDLIAARVQGDSGLLLDGARRSSLAAAVARLGAGSPAEVLRRLDDPAEGRTLLAHLVDEVAVKETFFLRNTAELEALDWRALLASARARGQERVRVWVTACATGDEAYSLAILALEAFAMVSPPVEILATDLSATALERARQGRYRARATSAIPAELRMRWFVPDGHALAVRDPVRALVRFARHNLIRDPIPPLGQAPFDVITCRNVLIYFDEADVTRTVAGLERALAPGGRLVLGAADRLSGGTATMAAAETVAAAAAADPAPRLERAAADASAPAVTDAADGDLDADVALVLGRAARARGDHREAVHWLRRTLYLAPDRGVAALELALSLGSLGDREAQRRALWTALHTAQDTGDTELAAECRARLGDGERRAAS
jgi:chemotaxis methyl-accepting protein methylase